MRRAVIDRGLFVALMVFVAGRCLVPMDETDLFFNLRLGEIILETHAVPRTNLLSFTWPDFPETNLAWLFQIVLALAHRAGGIPATVGLKTAFVLATFAVLWRVGRRRGAQPALLAAVLALAAWAAEPRFSERPHLVTFLGLALTLLALERAEAGRPRLLYALCPVGVVWANANSCFFLAPALLALYAAGAVADGRRADGRRAALVGAALLPIIFATPAGTRAAGYIANHFRIPWLRPLQEYRTAAWPLDGPFFFVVALLATAAALAASQTASNAGRPRPWTIRTARTLLPAAALALLGWRRIRFVAETALCAGPAIAATASAWLRARWPAVAEGDAAVDATVEGRAPAPSIAVGCTVIGALVALTVAPRVADARAGAPWFNVGEQSGLVPRAAIDFADQHGLRQRMYNNLEVGSYLTWQGWPRHRVFQDPRINSYPDEFHALLRRADLTRAEWQRLCDRFGVTSALITYPAVNPRGALFDPARWALVYRTPEALIFARRLPQWTALLAAEELPLTFQYDADSGLSPVALESEPAGAPLAACEWSRRLGDFFIANGDPRSAFAAYRSALPDDGGASAGSDTGACAAAAWRPATERALAALALQFDDAATAAEVYGRMPDADARSSRGFALLKMRRAGDALAEFDRALALAPEHADALLGRGLALEAMARPATEVSAAFRVFLAHAPTHPAAADVRARLERSGPINSPDGAAGPGAW